MALKNQRFRKEIRRAAARDRQTARAERSDAEQLQIILARGARDTNREVIRLRGA